MNKQDELQKPEASDVVPETAPPKTLVQQAKTFMNGVLSPLKGKDIGQLVEDFTAEMTLVIEGMSEDQTKLAQDTQRLSAQQTELEQHMLDGFHDAETSENELRKEITSLKNRLDKAEKQLQEKKGKHSEGLASILRQATWLAAIIAGAWIIVTVINLFR